MLFPFRREFSEPPELADNLSQLGVGLGGGGLRRASRNLLRASLIRRGTITNTSLVRRSRGMGTSPDAATARELDVTFGHGPSLVIAVMIAFPE